LEQAEITDSAIIEQFVVDAGLLDAGGSDPRDLRWLTGTRVKAGVLALWEDGNGRKLLKVVGVYDPAEVVPIVVGTMLSSEEFPPEPLIVGATAGGREACVVVPVSTKERDWGLLAVVAEIDPTTARETLQHWAALLCASLESQRLQEVVRRSALFDALTGLPNRQFFVKQLEHALALWQRSQTPFAVLFLDVDGFKLVNDSLGHQMGDRVLVAVGADITQELRSVDTGARFGGDEFVILLTDTDAAGALVVAQKVQARLAKVHEFGGHEIVVRASIGIATSVIDYVSAEDVLHDADTAMYQAKSAEPGTVAFFDAPMHVSALLRASLTRELDEGLRENQFELHYQPIVNLTTGRTDRFEALVRWRHPERGQLLPDEFLPSMEETGLIVQLGHWVITEVCRQLVEWGPEVVNVSINISDKEFWSQDLLTRVLASVQRHDLAPDRLTLEITESVLMRRPELALRLMKKMHEAGLRLHIDDFGTGYSSLETLHRFPVDAFKIDRSFIRTLTSSDNSVELISALVKLGKALGIAVVAEGVETGEQLAFLQEIGCATGQGYLFMPAVSGDRVADLLGHSLHAEGPG
jgi:diguanylate cyclase (GGDEF)-like protein